jgi:hypothetical protein
MWLVAPLAVAAPTAVPRVEWIDTNLISSTPRLGEHPEQVAALRAQLPAAWVDAVVANVEESAWPPGIDTLEERNAVRYSLSEYVGYAIATLDGGTVVWVPAAENHHLEGALRPEHDWFVWIGAAGLTLRSDTRPFPADPAKAAPVAAPAPVVVAPAPAAAPVADLEPVLAAMRPAEQAAYDLVAEWPRFREACHGTETARDEAWNRLVDRSARVAQAVLQVRDAAPSAVVDAAQARHLAAWAEALAGLSLDVKECREALGCCLSPPTPASLEERYESAGVHRRAL